MRGRALEVLVHPFGFREALRHAGAEPESLKRGLTKALRSDLDHRLRTYLIEDGIGTAAEVNPRKS